MHTNFPACAIDDTCPENIIEGRNIVLNYGKIEIFQERTKHISFLRPLTQNQIEYIIKRDDRCKLVKESFEPDHTAGVLNPNEHFNLPITYKPTLASPIDREIFHYIDSEYEIIRITVTGTALGPHCTTSTKKIIFYKTPHKSMLQGQVEITNESLATAHFKIDYAKGDIFRITPIEGIIKPHGYQLLTVKFVPTKTGFFTRKVFCLIWNSDPLVFDFLGLYDDHFRDVERGLKNFNLPPDQTYGFGAYFGDSLKISSDSTPFSLSENILDFGCVQVKGKNPRTQITSITNHMNNIILVEWEKGTQIFQITPERENIVPGSTKQFVVEFNPDENYNTFSETLVAQVHWKIGKSDKIPTRESESRPTAPLMCTLRVQGHSFPENESWITHIEVLPEVVYFSPCLPGEKAYTTFRLQNKSHLPVMYKLVPPKTTNLIAKPMIGKFKNFEIIAVQLQTEKPSIKTYIEEWKILINGREEKQMTVYFHGETNIPTVEIGKKNRIRAGSVQEGSQKSLKVVMKNTSYFTISYKLRLKERSLLSIEPMEGIVQANGSTKLEITVTGVKCAPKREKFICEIHIIETNGATSGETYEVSAELFSESSYSQLSACPSAEHFENQPFGKKLSCEFECVNFGDSPIFFQACQCGDDIRDDNIRIHPCFGIVKPKDCIKFVISGIISLVGEQVLYFGYYNRVSRDSPMVTGTPTPFFTLTYNAEFPVIQIQDIVEHNLGPLFGKPILIDEYLHFHQLNNTLEEIIYDETEQVDIRLPDFEVQDKVFTIVLAVTNVTPYDTTVTLKRKKLCDCELVEQPQADFTKRKKGFDCPHREAVTMELNDTRFLAGTIRYLVISIKYCIPKTTRVCYIMELSNHRAVEIYFKMYAISPESPRLSLYTEQSTINLKNVFIGTRVAPIQMLWMYNNTSKLLNIDFDTTEIEYLCKREGFKVMEILNPNGQMLPYSPKALLVKFLPIELKSYSVKIDVTYNNPGEEASRTCKFEIHGRGEIQTNKGSIVESPSGVSQFSGTFPISLSIEYIDIKALPVWNRRKVLIFIKNNLKRKIIQYVWGSIKIDDVIEIFAERPYGLLHPKEVHPVTLVVKSFAEPCTANLLLPCEIINYTDLITHQITKQKHKEAQNRIDAEFTVSTGSKKIEPPTNPITIVPEPETMHTTLSFNITTLHTRDLDQNMDANIQFKQYPNQAMENIPKNLLKVYYPEVRRKLSYPEKKILSSSIGVAEKAIFCRVLEEALGDVLYSEAFKKCLKVYSKAPLHYYSEFVMDDRQVMSTQMIKAPLSNEDIANFRKREIEKFLVQPKVTELSNILQHVIYESISRLIQCYRPELNLNEINYKIESSLYSCKNQTCRCNMNKSEDT